MSEEDISLFELLNSSIGTPQPGAVNFSALHALLHAVLRQLGLQDLRIRWSDSAPRDSRVYAPVGVTGSGEEEQLELRSLIHTCEDGVAQALSLVQELCSQRDDLQGEIKELRHELEVAIAKPVEVTETAVEQCYHRVDALEETVELVRNTVQKYPDPEELTQRVTWEIVHSALHSERETLQKELVNSGIVNPNPDYEVKMEDWFNKLEARVTALEEGNMEPSQSQSLSQGLSQSQLTELREVITIKDSQDESNNMLLVDELKQQRALIDSLMSDRDKLDNLEDMLMNLMSQESETTPEEASGSVDIDSKAFHEFRQQISYLRKSVQRLEEGVKLLKTKQALLEEKMANQRLQDQLDDLRSTLEDMMLSLSSQLSSSLQDESDSQDLSQSSDTSAFTASAVHDGKTLSRLFLHYSQLQDTVNKLLQQQTGGRAGTLKYSQNSELLSDVQNAILQLQAESKKLHETTRCLHEDNREKQSHIEELYKVTEELGEKKADKQMVESEIKADKFALDSKVSRLQFDTVTEQLSSMFHELLNKVMDQEQDWHKVIDKLSTEMECKLNRIELDSVKKQLEDRWKNIHEKLQAQGAPEHEDAAGIRKQLVDRFHCLSCDRSVVMHAPGPHVMTLPSTPGFPAHKSIRPFTVYALEQFRQHYRSPKPETSRYKCGAASAAKRREQLQRSHAETCMQIEGSQGRLMHSSRAGSQGAINKNQIQSQKQPGVQHERITKLTDHTHPSVARSCGGSHTVTLANQRRSGMQHTKHLAQPEGDGANIQSEEVDIIGVDGHIYRGRLYTPAIRHTETKLPTISSRDGTTKSKDKTRGSPSLKPAAASPEVGHSAPVHPPHSAKTVQSACSSSGRDSPVSALVCPSQTPIATAEHAAEAQDNPQADL